MPTLQRSLFRPKKLLMLYRLVFGVVAVYIITSHTGSLGNNFSQTEYVLQSVDIDRAEAHREEVFSVEQFWQEISHRLDFLKENLESEIPTLTSDTMFPLTVVRLRQQRTVNSKDVRDSCGNPRLLEISSVCRVEVGEVDWEDRHFSRSWQRPRRQGIVYQRATPYTYVPGHNDTLHTSTNSFMQYNYPGDGYDQILTVEQNNYPLLVQYLKDSGWLDGSTQMVRMDSVLYNDDTKMVTTVTVVYEFTQVAIFRSIDADTQLLMSSFSNLDDPSNIAVLLLAVFAICVLVEMLMELAELKTLGFRKYLRLSKLGVMFEICLCVTMVVLNVYKELLIQRVLKDLREVRFLLQHTEVYVNVRSRQDLAFAIEATDTALIILLVVQLGVHSQGYQFPKRVLKIIIGLHGALFFPFLVMFGSTIIAFMWFVTVENFTDPISCFYNVLIYMMRQNYKDNMDLWEMFPTKGRLYTGTVGFLMNIIVLNAFIIEFVHVYEKVKKERERERKRQ